MSKFSLNPTRRDNQHPNESARDYSSRLLLHTFQDVFYQASGRGMTFEFQEAVADQCSDIVSALMEAVREDQRPNW